MRSKKADTSIGGKTVTWILVALVIILALALIIRVDISKWLNFLPSFGNPEGVKYVDKCPVKIAEIKDGMILFCNQETKACNISSKLQIDGEKIQVDYTLDTDIGQITSNILIIIFDEVVKREGKVYSSVARDLPNYFYILNLNGAYLHSKTEICRDEIVNEEKFEYSPEEKIGVLGYGASSSGWKIWQLLKSGYSAINSKEKIFSYNQLSGETYSNLFLESNFVYFDKVGFNNLKVGVRNFDIIYIYSPYLDSEPSGVNPKGFLKELNGSRIIGGEIYKK